MAIGALLRSARRSTPPPEARSSEAGRHPQSSFLLFFPLLFLTPNFVPFNRLSPLMETLAHINPVSYVIVGMRSLVIDGWNLGELAVCFGVIVGLGIVLTGLSLRSI
ncbi:MAG: ABC transporter permease, partial [Actinomycetota bacterium]|nr:ABC transporter permease [Actinomycetota bacterium]